METVIVHKGFVMEIPVVRPTLNFVPNAILRQCTACEAGTTWDGIKCAGTPTFTPLTGTKQKEGIDMIDNTCGSISSVFPQCFEPTNACEVDACKDGDTCTPKGADGMRNSRYTGLYL